MLYTLLSILLFISPAYFQPSRSKLGIHLIGRYTQGAKMIINSGPRVIKLLDPQASGDLKKAMKEYKAMYPQGIVVVRIWERTPNVHYSLNDDPVASAEDFWKRVLQPAIEALSPEERKMIDFLEGPNEGETTPTWENIESARWFGKFWEKLAELIHKAGFRPCGGSIAVGNPPGTIPEIWDKLEAFIPALKALKKYKGAWSYHAYSLEYSTDPNVEKWYSLRYRIFYNFLKKKHPDLANLPMILTEGGIDKAGNPESDGWMARGNEKKYQEWLKWFDEELKKDKYILGVTLFQIGNPEGWHSFDLEPIAQWLANYLQENRPLIKR
ncbi:hypothetical protein H5T87_07900 [bacterium]|nr:hypothetical protein [bacterium]